MKNIFLILFFIVLVGGATYALQGNKTNFNEGDDGVVNGTTLVSARKTLDLSDKGLTQVPEYVFSNNSIEKLDLSNNKLTGALPAEVRHLQNLKILDLSNNQFTGVPAEIGQLKNLEVLDLSNNSITGLPYELGNLQNLKILYLSGNDYSEQDFNIIRESLPSSVEFKL